MTERDYQAIARAIYNAFGDKQTPSNERLGSHGDYCRERVAQELAAALAADNPAFDRARFIEATRARRASEKKR